MTPQVKQQIEQIRRGEMPEGYKKTKVGVVPNDWEENRLSHYLKVNNDKNVDLKYGKEDVFSISGELGIVNQIELLGRSYAGASVAPYGIVYPNDVVYTKSPLKANPYGIIKTNKTGKVGIVSTLYAVFHCKENVSPNFVQTYFEWDKKLNNYLYPIVNIGAKHDMKISDENSLKGYVVFPHRSEQEKIAKILSMQDKLIALKEKLIEEKKRQKKALMQQFLTGEKRLPGFSDEWISFSISEVVLHITTGLNPRDNFRFNEKGECFYVTIKNFHDGCIFLDERCDKITQHDRELIHTRSKIDKGDILFASIGRVGDTYLIKEAPTEWDINESVFAIRANTNKVYSELLNYVLSSPFSKKKFISKVTGSTFQSIKINDLLKHKIKIPLSFDEQRQLIEFFDIIEKEVILLQKELDQEKQKKKALMQLLLTGIVRV